MAGESQRPGFRILSRRMTMLADGTPALEIVNVLGATTVGRSRKIFTIVANRGFVVNAETYLDAWPSFEPVFDRVLTSFTVAPPTWQSRLADARRLAADSEEYSVTTASGVFVFQNARQPLCHAYSIPGDWVAADEPSAYRSPDGSAFVGVLMASSQELQASPGRSPAERALNGATRRYEQGLGQRLTVRIDPVAVSRPGVLKWSSAPIVQPTREIALPVKFAVPLEQGAALVITVADTADDDGLARRIIETLQTASDRACFWPALEELLKTLR
jgi:hypothetical protein